jgi:hypothetical protein
MPKKLALVSESETAPALGKDDSVLITAYVSKELAAEIDEFRWANRIEGRAATVRRLIETALHPA